MLSFGFSLRPWCYDILSEAKAAFLRPKGIPALAYLDDSWINNLHRAFTGWLRASSGWRPERLHTWPRRFRFLCGQFLSTKKCNFRPTRQQQILGMVCDSDTVSFRVPRDKSDKLEQLLRETLAAGRLSVFTLQRIAVKCMSITVAIRPASLWTHAIVCGVCGARQVGTVLHRPYPRLEG